MTFETAYRTDDWKCSVDGVDLNDDGYCPICGKELGAAPEAE